MNAKVIFSQLVVLFVSLLICSWFYNQTAKPVEVSAGTVAKVATSSLPFSAHVLVYHSVRPIYSGMTEQVHQYAVSPDTFERQLQYLNEAGYHVVSLDDLVMASKGAVKLPTKPVVITLDDGWENQYVYAFPILKKYNMPATFFIFTNAPGHKNWMTWDQIRELDAAGMNIGSHSKSHPYLEKITDSTKLNEEIVSSKKIIETKLGKEIYSFAYPFGEHNTQLMTLVENTGYRAARIFGGGPYQSSDNPFSIKSVVIPDDFERFKQLLK